MASTLRQNYATGDDTNSLIYGNAWRSQTFTVAAEHSIDQVDLYLGKTGAPTGTLTAGIYETSAGLPVTSGETALTEGTKAVADIATGPAWVTVTFSTPSALTAGTKYAIVLHGPVGSGSAYINWRLDTTAGTKYANGSTITSANAGALWSAVVAQDQLFKEYGDFSVASATPVDKVYSRKLVAIDNNEVWYESAADTMAEITAARSDIDVTEPLTVVEAFQKVFVANRTDLKIVDFANTKLTIAALTTVPTRGSTVTQITSNATIIVDFVNGAKTEIYGYTTSGTDVFVTTAGYTISGGGLTSANSLVPTAVNEASTTPHWYDWSEYGITVAASTNMPSSAYLIALYRGRVVLAGNPNEPHMWWMSKVADPFNYAYSSTVVTSAVAGNNTKAGKIGDIIRTMISFGDDFLVFGCANSVHVLDGDPLADGSIDKLSDDTGIFSFTSWCKDDADNLYFYGNHGIYMMAGGRGKPTNISKSALPNLALDWVVDPLLHRVVLAYDVVNRGVVIVKTTLADGTCSGYFYSLDTTGYYPISFANTGDGIYCAFDYNADDPTYRKLLFGCYDGYIRKLLGTNKNDDYGDASSAATISSYFGIVDRISEDSDKEGKLTSLTVEMAGGKATIKLTHTALTTAHAEGDTLTQATTAATMVVIYSNAAKTLTFGHRGTGTFNTTNAVTSDGLGTGFTPTAVGTGSFADTDGCSYEYHKGDDAESCLERVKDGAAPFTNGTLTGPGRKNRIRNKIRAAWVALKFYNSSASETFGINNVYGEVKPSGKIK